MSNRINITHVTRPRRCPLCHTENSFIEDRGKWLCSVRECGHSVIRTPSLGINQTQASVYVKDMTSPPYLYAHKKQKSVFRLAIMLSVIVIAMLISFIGFWQLFFSPELNAPVFGTLHFSDGIFTGYHLDGQLINGVYIWNTGSSFDGEWVYTEHGRLLRGRLEWYFGDVFVGDIDAETKNTIYGRYLWPNGGIFYGEWNWVLRYFSGIHTFPDGSTRTGRFSLDTGEFLD